MMVIILIETALTLKYFIYWNSETENIYGKIQRSKGWLCEI